MNMAPYLDDRTHRDHVPDELRTQTRDLTQCHYEYDEVASFVQGDRHKRD